MSISQNMIYDMIFKSNTKITALDLHYKGVFSCAGGVFPSPDVFGDWYFVQVAGVLPAPVGVTHEGDALVYNGTQWERTRVMSAGVSLVNGKSGAVTIVTDDISDTASIKKFITQIEKDKLSTIETGAEVNDTASELKVKYESNADTNAYTDAEKAKLALIPADAEKNTIDTIKLNGVTLVPDGTGAVDVIIGSVFKYMGTVPTLPDLPTATAQTGHVYRVVSEGFNYVFNESGTWDSLGGDVDLTNFYTKSEVYSKTETDTLLVSKVSAVAGKQLTTEDYTTIEKTKLTGIEDGAQKNTSKVKVSLTDLVESELYNKISPGTNITIAIVDVGGDEKLEISSTAGGGGTGTVESVNGVLPVAGNVTVTKTDIGLPNVTNHQQIPITYLDVDGTLTANSDLKVPTQKAVKTYVSGLSSVNSHGVANMPTITDNGDGSITIGTDGIISFYKDANAMNGLVRMPITNSSTITLVDNSMNFIYCDYNNGTPTYMVGTTYDYYTNAQYSPVCRISRQGTKLTIIGYSNYGNAQASKTLLKDTILNGFQREYGLLLTTSSTRVVSVSAGLSWLGVNPIQTLESTSNNIGVSMYEYYKTSGNWTRSAVLTQHDATYYSDGNDRLTLSAGQWVSKYIFKAMGSLNELYYVSGNAYGSKSLAVSESIPEVPSYIAGISVCVGKIVIQKDQAVGTAYTRNWKNINFNGCITEHNDLNNILGVGLGVSKGHVSDQDETFYGKKTFNSEVTSSDYKVVGMTGNNVILNNSIKDTLANIDNIYTITKDSTGFTAPTSVIVTYDSTNRTITITGTVEAYYRGKKVTSMVSGWVSAPHAVGFGEYYLSYNGTAYVWTTTQPNYYDLQIAYVIYNSTDKLAIKETHGFMQWESHKFNHETMGTYMSSGGNVSGIVMGSSTPTDRRPIVSPSNIVDEDCSTLLPINSSSLYSILNINGSTYSIQKSHGEIVPVNGSNPYFNEYDGTWKQTLMSDDKYQVLFLLAIPTSSDVASLDYRYIWVQGQRQFSSLYQADAVETGDIELADFKTKVPEFIYIGKMIIKYKNLNWTIVSYEKLYGYRNKQLSTYSSPYLTDVFTDGTISGTGNIDSPLSITTSTVDFTNKTIDGGTY